MTMQLALGYRRSIYQLSYIAFTRYSAPVGERGTAMSTLCMCVCLSVRIAYHMNHASELQQLNNFLSMLFVAVSRSFDDALQYVMYFRFCG